ncbi:aspartate-semialdehyde dehydrogenase [Actinobacillus succinogenes]|uniref:Aspartate-semialdehyde dehydrogenase n=1 Tax=Actinobacillus succinogenes (strain ATCC 55618 / DSM 22257 / CCUG 43843 / 130Z) TaxID=339671 RepID=A6VPQ2_ACTSZ|nr:oxidoreductase [Actinobacillus succinogenes]ABR74949.1 aspartate-semialdehyde dehydrogenase [Actinobacillus succinogenes 130Z]PHI40640.1 aspartate-semialdehyde dehydrogenase [Actinobacillus succinogenes]
MKTLNIAIAAEFDLCEKLTEFLERSELAVGQISIVEIIPFNEEQRVRFNQRAVEQVTPDEADWAKFDYLLFAGNAVHAPYMANAAEAGCTVIDMKGVSAAISGVPVVVPSVNDISLAEARARNIVAMPDPQVSQLALSMAQFIEENQFNHILVTSLLPASYTDGETVGRLAGQTARLLNGIPLDDNEQRLAFDVFPKSAVNLTAQFQKIFPALNVTFHSIQVPVFYGLAQKVTALSDYEPETVRLLEQWRNNDLIEAEERLVTPVLNGEAESGEDAVKLHLGGLSAVENGIEFWSVADEQRFNLAFLTVKLLEKMVRQLH